MMSAQNAKIIRIRAAVNKWLMGNFTEHRKYLQHEKPAYDSSESLYTVVIVTKDINGHSVHLGELGVDERGAVIYADNPVEISKTINRLLNDQKSDQKYEKTISGTNYIFNYGDGIEAVIGMEDGSIDLLLTDPPYGISKAYTCEKQIQRRLRTNGADFIMPRGHFGDWDSEISPKGWLNAVLPKVSGWFVSFCAHAQIGEYQKELERHKFVAVGSLVWHKTNPVPFNARFKPVNAWEAAVVGKRSGVKFNSKGAVHNVFTYKSPSPQNRIHPTQKPLDFMEHLVELLSQPGDMVVDPFAGSGTTVIAAAMAGRKGVGYEASAEHYWAACKRIKEALSGH